MYWNFNNHELVLQFWADAPVDGIEFDVIMNAANALCVSFAPTLSDGEAVPDNYLIAEILQAYDIWSKVQVGSSDGFGPADLTIPVYPLTATVRTLLRPKTSPFGLLR